MMSSSMNNQCLYRIDDANMGVPTFNFQIFEKKFFNFFSLNSYQIDYQTF